MKAAEKSKRGFAHWEDRAAAEKGVIWDSDEIYFCFRVEKSMRLPSAMTMR